MNERIKELEKQCWAHRIDGALVDGHLHFDTTKFTELIVKECCQKLENDGMVEIAIELKQHFGVEECISQTVMIQSDCPTV